MPLSRCSMTCVTVSSSVLADAPGYVAITEMVGGAMLGYCAMGRLVIESAPASMITIAMTHAKTGRSMKNRDIGDYFEWAAAAGVLAAVADGGAASATLTGEPG